MRSAIVGGCLKINTPSWGLKFSLTFIDKHSDRRKCGRWALGVTLTSGERHWGEQNPEVPFFTWIWWLASKRLRQKTNKCLRIVDDRAGGRDVLGHLPGRIWNTDCGSQLSQEEVRWGKGWLWIPRSAIITNPLWSTSYFWLNSLKHPHENFGSFAELSLLWVKIFWRQISSGVHPV